MGTWKTRGLRGSTLEDLINRTNDSYREKKLALIQKIPTPITPIEIDKKSRHITLAYFDMKSTVDYIGAVQGIPVCFDAKECAVRTFPLQNIHPHQIAFMKEFEAQGGVAFIILSFTAENEIYYVPFDVVNRFWERMEEGGRKSFTYDEVVPEAYRIRSHRDMYVHYLEGIQQDLDPEGRKRRRRRMIEMVIWLVVIAVFVFRALKQNGTLDELFAGAKKRKENQAERVVYEQPEEGSGKKEKKKGPGIRVPKHTGFAVTMVVIVLAAAVLSFDSFYTLSEEEMAVVTTFGKPSVEEASGLHFKIPVIQRVTKVSKAITGMQIGYTTDPARADGASIDNPVSIENESLMITKDFNLTNVDFYVEYMVTDPVQAVRHRSVYESIIKNLAQSYIRDTVGVYNVDDVITTGKTQIQERIKEQLTNRLVEENIGYGIYNVSIQDTEMPRDDVANAFKAVEDAKQGMETAINSAKKYQSENIPEAKAKADKLLQDAEAYKEQRINEANGQVARFEDTYAEYVKYPLITKKRMFYETMEEVLPDLKVIITGGNGTQTLLPLEPFSETASGSAAQTGGGN